MWLFFEVDAVSVTSFVPLLYGWGGLAIFVSDLTSLEEGHALSLHLNVVRMRIYPLTLLVLSASAPMRHPPHELCWHDKCAPLDVPPPHIPKPSTTQTNQSHSQKSCSKHSLLALKSRRKIRPSMRPPTPVWRILREHLLLPNIPPLKSLPKRPPPTKGRLSGPPNNDGSWT